MTVLDKPEQIAAFRLLTLHKGLQLETKGMRLTRGPSCSSRVKKEFGIRGNTQKVLAQFEKMLKEKGILGA